MDDRKSKSNSRQSRKVSGFRLNKAIEACKKSGHYSMVPNCLYKMDLTWQEREIWMYLNRIEPWDLPSVNAMRKTLQMQKSAFLAAINKLCEMNILTVDGQERKRCFHIQHPVYWDHEIPKRDYAILPNEEWPMDLREEFIGIPVRKCSKGNTQRRPLYCVSSVPSVPNGTLECSKRNTFSGLSVPNGTLESGQNHELQGVVPSLKTLSQDVIRQIKTPHESANRSKRNASKEKPSMITLTELDGLMLGLYDQLAKPKAVSAVIRELLRNEASRDEILQLIEAQREKQERPLSWDPSHNRIWLAKLNALKGKP